MGTVRMLRAAILDTIMEFLNIALSIDALLMTIHISLNEHLVVAEVKSSHLSMSSTSPCVINKIV
ncbi:hypothetical protein C5167_025456 [Papaver somniferum]|uniref:Uncharacterized protein n=1 Tax=Papaver somniferum TaxID=3469 RepID=A0A4Y7JUI0_PAPSO|nr:hypothetical protein C5167_025456 [Papaver somniferum]